MEQCRHFSQLLQKTLRRKTKKKKKNQKTQKRTYVTHKTIALSQSALLDALVIWNVIVHFFVV